MENPESNSIFASPDFWASWREECRQIADGTAPKISAYDSPVAAERSIWTDEQKKIAATNLFRGVSLAIAAHGSSHTADELRVLIKNSGGRESFIALYAAP